jgi:hypothetical protein
LLVSFVVGGEARNDGCTICWRAIERPKHGMCHRGPAATGIASIEMCGTNTLTSPRDSPWGRRAVIRDLDGHSVELIEH